MLECKICGKALLSINYLHLRIHNISLSDYRRKYYNQPVHSEEVINKIRSKMIGNKYSLGKISTKKGLKLIDFYGEERARQIIEKISIAKKGKVSPRKGLNAIAEYGESKALMIGNKIKVSKTGRTYDDLYGTEAESKRQKKIDQGLYHNPFKGKHFSAESKKKLAQAQIDNNLRGKNNPRYGTKLKPEQIEQMSKTMLAKWQDPVFRDKNVKATMAALLDYSGDMSVMGN